ncbi:MAG: hypothetical protein HY815_20805 [Candidatus Riflebacteria bacterium]|nr:hypothetical protein [Candidatus Riflebacteria bacterium]
MARPTRRNRPIFHWYRQTPFGPELVICLFTRGCRYRSCSFCALPSVTAGEVDESYREINAQVDHVFAQFSGAQLQAVWKLSIFNNGSVLDQATMPTKSLLYLFLKAADLPSLKVVSLESREEYVEDWELKVLRQILGGRAELEITLGFETHDERIRNRVLNKGLTVKRFEKLLEMLAANGVRLKCYVMLKPDVMLTEEQGIEEAVRTIEYLGQVAGTYRVAMAVHLNPTYVARGTRLERQFKENGYLPPDLDSIFRVVLSTQRVGLWTYVGLDDEGLAATDSAFRCERLPRQAATAALERFNATNDYEELRAFYQNEKAKTT